MYLIMRDKNEFTKLNYLEKILRTYYNGIKDTSRKPYIQDNDTKVKIGIDLPIRRGDDKDGFFATTSTTIESV